METPGPASYEIQPKDDQKAKNGEKILIKSNSVFLSKVNRNNHINIIKKTKQNPGLEKVCYDDRANTIAETVKKNKFGGNNHALV